MKLHFSVAASVEDDSVMVCFRCGRCNRFMRYISAKPQRLYCNTCDETYALPQGGTVKLYKVTFYLVFSLSM